MPSVPNALSSLLVIEPQLVAARSAVELPSWHPAWAKQFAEAYFSGVTSLFVLHGNVHDLQPTVVERPAGDETPSGYLSLPEFLATQVFGSWDVVLHYDVGRGLRPLAGANPERLKSMLQKLTPRLGEPGNWPRDPDQVLQTLDRFVERVLLDDAAPQRMSVGLIFDHAQYLIPSGDLASLTQGLASRLVRFLSWAQNPYFKRINLAFCLLADKLSELNARLVESPHMTACEVPMPDRAEREQFANSALGSRSVDQSNRVTPAEAADFSNGLSLVSLDVVLSRVSQTASSSVANAFGDLKKSLIERQCQGLVEFIEPHHTLDLVVGQDAAKKRLAEDAECLARGQREAAPMGYLVSGPVGTGKTFLAECYAASIGVPCLKLRNFRSKYVGETEGNLELLLRTFRSLGPVVVVIDEADAALGNRQSEGDSGTSSRVFSLIASQMGDTRYRGQIVWMLLTSRPDLLPIDLKRQGRAEVHIPLFYPQTAAETENMFRAMARKNKVQLPEGPLPALPTGQWLSGADIESVLLAARRRSLAAKRAELAPADMEQAIRSFIPSVQGLEKELQELAAVLECTEMDFLPQAWRQRVAEPEGRTRLQERFVAIRQLLG